MADFDVMEQMYEADYIQNETPCPAITKTTVATTKEDPFDWLTGDPVEQNTETTTAKNSISIDIRISYNGKSGRRTRPFRPRNSASKKLISKPMFISALLIFILFCFSLE